VKALPPTPTPNTQTPSPENKSPTTDPRFAFELILCLTENRLRKREDINNPLIRLKQMFPHIEPETIWKVYQETYDLYETIEILLGNDRQQQEKQSEQRIQLKKNGKKRKLDNDASSDSDDSSSGESDTETHKVKCAQCGNPRVNAQCVDKVCTKCCVNRDNKCPLWWHDKNHPKYIERVQQKQSAKESKKKQLESPKAKEEDDGPKSPPGMISVHLNSVQSIDFLEELLELIEDIYDDIFDGFSISRKEKLETNSTTHVLSNLDGFGRYVVVNDTRI
jgi:hypothetical protein